MLKNHYSKFVKSSKILVTCEHSSKRIPRKYKNLGLSRGILSGAKDLYDPGSLEVFRLLAKKLNASYIYSNVSRLVIDYNRLLDGKNNNNNTFHSVALKTNLLTEIDGREEMVEIPLNLNNDINNSRIEEKKRFDKFVLPYLKDSEKIISRINTTGKKHIIMIHSFFPTYNGDTRKIDIGVLYDRSDRVAKDIIKNLRKNTKLKIGDNSPWKMTDVDGIFSKLTKEKNVELIAFDINNKHLKNIKDIEKISLLIHKSLVAVLK